MKIIKNTEIGKKIARLKAEGKKIVFTNGCFDLLHVGHVRYLSKAKKLGDILVIGLNSDKSVSRIKPGRPLTPEKQRAEVLSALSAVDYVTIFSEETPLKLIKKVKPDILVKGADWAKEDIVGNDIVNEVRTIPFVKGISTSKIIKKILSAHKQSNKGRKKQN
ncbi:MAG: D-glycero-beta-D-manno-heptose 1-phosphate adenylyltransferase [Nitrospirae bacterium]|nr:D-glycero-beta-D-manno-heptose 1-phosphate adenylyltransferase [Nitrospirota bacterium]